MEKETVDSEKMYFEDLPECIQDVIIDFIVSIIENQERSETIKEKAQKCRINKMAVPDCL